MKRIRNGVRCAAYIMLIMLLLLGSLPLSGVFAEVAITEDTLGKDIQDTESIEVQVPEFLENTTEEVVEITESIFTQELEIIEDVTLEEAEATEGTTEEKKEPTPQEKLQIQLQASIEKEGHFSYREDYGKSVLLSFFVEDWQEDMELHVTIVSTNEAVIKPIKQQEEYSVSEGFITYTITGVGEAELILELVENEWYVAEIIRIPVKVMNSGIDNEDFEIFYFPYNTQEKISFASFTEWKQFLEQHHYWLSGTIQLGVSQSSEVFYEKMHIKKENEEVWGQKQHDMVEETTLQNYEFWLSHSQTNTSTENAENGKRTFQLGIDRTAPQNTNFSYNQNAYEISSTESVKYYSEDVTFRGVFEDFLSGVERIEYTTQADLGELAKWENINGIDFQGTQAIYEQELGEGVYTGVAFRAIDKAGNISETIELKNAMGDFIQLIVDNREPLLDIMLKTQDENRYLGDWTNKGITIMVQEDAESQTLAGIQCIQYQYVSVGGEYQSEKWIQLPIDKKIEIGYDEQTNVNQNGIYYFRAISNTGVVTTIETQKRTAHRIRLQQSLPARQEKIENAPELKEGQEWYNKQTGVPMISFAYPDYDDGMESLEYGAPITVCTKITRKLEESKEAEKNGIEIFEQSATIGIRNDEQYQQIMQIRRENMEQGNEDYIKEKIQQNIELLNLDFSYDSQTGYAKDGIYELQYWIKDEAGNESDHVVYTYKIDTHEPERLEVFVDGIKMQEGISKVMEYERFYQSAVSGYVSADYGVSGKRSMKLMLTEETEITANSSGWQESDEFVIKPCERGCVYMLAEDVAGNQAILKTKGIVVDNLEPKGEYGGKVIKLLTKANDNLFYNDDITFSLSAEDMPQEKGFSGIESFTCVVGTTEKEQKKEFFSFTQELPGKEELIAAKSYTTTEILNAATYEGNDSYIEIMVQDRCGNVTTEREMLKIDVTEPQVEINFEQKEPRNDRYYQQARTATIHIQELNFDGNRVKIEVTKDNEIYPFSISEWYSEGMEHWANIIFSEDGDYTMSVTCTDLADNVSEEVSIEPFTVDMTTPIVEITYHNQDVQNEHYYQTGQTVTILVKEHNFSEADFTLHVEPQMAFSEWSHRGDEHFLELHFTQDNSYRFWCSVLDLAGNEAETIEEQRFVIDSIAPQIVIKGLEDGSANAGEIQPIVMVYDTNPNVQGVEIDVTTGLGEKIATTVQTQTMENGYSYYLTDITQQVDNVYLLDVTAYDLAGNSSTLSYRFSLNRHGSTYDLSKLDPYIERIYNRFEQFHDLQIIEMNVDEIKEYAFYVTRNGKMLTCIEMDEKPQDFLVEDAIYYIVEKEGDERKGYINSYLFFRENFRKEGTYRIICYSKDQAGNENNNTLEEKKAEISFVMDNTTPKVVVNGMKEGGIYNKEELKVNIMVQDNFMLSKADFSLVTEEGEILQSWNYMECVQNIGDTMTITIPSREEKQFLAYYVCDTAGNELVLLPDTQKAPKGFLVTTNAWLRFISSPAKVTVSVIACICVIVTGMFCTKRKYHKKGFQFFK